ncbi:MAG: hypothetical protein IPN40_09175 [Uliginosibacterium sp.]|nr:hypothetical protein [Uliginosibacterium sp.]
MPRRLPRRSSTTKLIDLHPVEPLASLPGVSVPYATVFYGRRVVTRD